MADNHEIQIGYRTLSIHVNNTLDGAKASSAAMKHAQDPRSAIRDIDVHLLTTEEIFTRFSSSPTVGLEHAAVQRKSKSGKNVISPPKTQYWKKALNYVFGGFNFLMWIAFIVTILSYKPLGDPNPAVFNLGVAILLLLVIIISGTFYAIVDWNASRVMKAITKLVAEEASVIRDSKHQTIPASELVVGDVVTLSMGDRVPADLRLVDISNDLRFDRSLLTGESDLIPGTILATSQNALETRNLALSSTFCVQGKCTGVVFAIGDKSLMGLIVRMSETRFKLTTVQKEVWFFTKIVSGLALSLFSISIIIWGAWLRRSFPGFETASGAIINSIGCLTAFVPQGLPVCVALSLTIVAKRMAKHHVLVKNLATVETLGCISVLCTDKTGTLTLGQMSVRNVAFVDSQHSVDEFLSEKPESSPPPALRSLHKVARLCNAAHFDAKTESLPVMERIVKGDATDTAVLRFAESLNFAGFNSADLLAAHTKVFEIPFNSTNKWMMTVVKEKNTSPPGESASESDPLMLIKGAPDVLFPSCSNVLRSDGTLSPLSVGLRRDLIALQESWSGQGQRVLALCMKPLNAVKFSSQASADDMEELMYLEVQDLTLVGLVGISDPPRPNVQEAIVKIRRAGVRTFMVTGDFKLTAVAIARQVGIVTTEKVELLDDIKSDTENASSVDVKTKPLDDDADRALLLTGDDLESLSSADWDTIIGTYTEIVFARTTPEQKLGIVEEIKARGDNTVAVTGDGVNDAPALRASDIGVAMGSGSDVAKDAASIILLNNDFASIPVAIEMGRLVFDNLKKVILYLMPAGTYAEFMTVFANVFLGMQLALSSYLQVCFSITNDVVMSISLMYEKPEADLMLRKPRNARTERLTDWRFFFQIYLFIGLMMWPCAMSMWFLYMSQQGLGFYDVILVYNKWTDGYKGYSINQLTHFVDVGQCIYYVTIVFLQYGGLLAARNRRVSILNSNPLWGPRRNLAVPLGMIGTALIAVVNLYGHGLQRVFATTPIPGMFWGIPFGFALAILIADEIRKLLVRTYPKSIVANMAW